MRKIVSYIYKEYPYKLVVGDTYLDLESKEILETLPPRKKSAFIREAIKEKHYGVRNSENSTRPMIHTVRFEYA